MSPNAPVRQRWKGTLLLATAVVLVTFALLPLQRASAHPATVTSSPLAPFKPTTVLIHGAFANSSSWDAVIQRLQQDGYPVVAPRNPLRSLQGDAATVAAFLKTISGPIILVGHSYGGAVITNAAVGNQEVKALVYVDAIIPDQGQSAAQVSSAQPGSCLAATPSTVFNTVPYPGAPAGAHDLYVKPNLFPRCFANGLPATQGAVLAATQQPVTSSALNDPSGIPAWKTIPSWALIGTADNVIPVAEQRIMARHAGTHSVEVKAPHLSMIARPDAVTNLIIAAAQATVHS
jgi:pimeloyl-ACP methyl ester carboxylesterase